MKLFKIMMLLLVAAFTGFSAAGQADAFINVLTQNSGQVGLGGTVFVQVDVGNAGPTSNIGVNKVRAQISIPIAIAHALPNAQQTGLPPGWSITVNSGDVITVCNGTDIIGVNETRSILIAVQGDALGGPSTITGVLRFSNGVNCAVTGTLAGDQTANNTSTSTIEVIPAPACSLAVSASAGTIACNGGSTTLTATPTGAGGAVEYSLTGGAPFQSGNTFTVSAGTYTVTAREVGNPSCTATASPVTVTQPTAITASAAAGTIACFGGSTTLTVTASGGTAPLQYSLNGGAFQAGNTFSVNAAGSPYTVTVRDANLCTATTNSVAVSQPTAITASAAAGTINCFGGTTTLTVTASGGTAPLQYSLNGGAFQAGNTFTVNAAGSPYTVTVRDASLCTATTNSVAVTQPTAITASAAAGTIACFGGTATLTVTASGGTAPLQYSLNGGAFQAGNTFTVNATGSPYTVTVKDASNCTATTNSVAVTQPTAITASAAAGTIACFGGTTTLTVTASGGTAPLQYSLNGGAFQAGNTFTVNAAGSPYTVTVKDASNCTATTNSVAVTQPTAITASAAAGTIACFGGTTTLTVTASGGTAPLQYSLNGGAFQAGNTFTVNAVGSPYTVTVRDANLCTATTNSVAVTQPTAITASAAAGTINCFGGTTTLTVTASGGTAPLQYSLNGGAFQAGNTFTVNAAGSPYTVTVKDANNCTATTNIVTVSQPTQLAATASSTPVTTIGGSNGTATANPSGGTSPYTYSWNSVPVQTTQTASGLTAGSYTVTVTDAKGCTTTATTTVGSPACNITASAATGTIACFGGITTLTVTTTGGTAPLQYSLNGGAFQAGNTFTVNAAGSPYTVTVKDASNCTATTNTVTVTQPTAITASAAAGTINCFGGTTTLTVTASGGTAPLQYSLNGGAFQAGNTFTVNAAGSPYTVAVKDASNCTATTNTVTVTQPTQLTATATSTPVTTIGGSNGTATAHPTGDTSPYTYSWNSTPVQTTVTASGLTAGSYTVTVTDAKGCTTTATTTVGSPACSITASATAGSAITCNGGTTTLTVTVTGGSAPIQYSLNGGAFQAGNTFTVGAGTYTVSVKDANNCTATTNSVTITQPTAVVVSANAAPIALPGGSTTVTIGASGGTPPYTGTGTFDRSAGTYTFIVTDANGCTGSTTITLSDPVPGNANASINLLTLNSGQVNQGSVVDVQVSVGNTGPSFIGVNKVRAQISIPIAIASALPNAQQTGLPPGWTITVNSGDVITVCNGSDQIPAGTQRQILIKVMGNTAGGPSTITGVLRFSNGVNCGTTGTLPGDLTADNTSTSSIEVLSTCNLSVTASAGTIACFGETTTLTATASGAAGAVEYSLNGGAFQAGNTFTVNAAGSPYTVTAREVANPTCTATSGSVAVTQPVQLTTTASSTPVTIIGGSDGTATANPAGGTPPYTYSWNSTPVQTTQTATGLTAGTYTVIVTDAKGCTASANTTVGSPACNITASIAAGTITCPGGTTTLTVTVTGGSAPVQYSLNGGAFQAGNTFAVGAGTYTVSVKDANLCTATTNTVTVAAGVDNINPTITAPSGISVCTNTGCTAIGVILGTPVTADNCSVASVTNNAPGAFPIGTTVVTWTVTDGSGHTATATQNVTVTDKTSPTIYVNQTGLLAGTTGPSSSASPYVLPLVPGVKFTSILSSGDNIGGYQMAGVPDGMGAFDNCDGTFTLLMNHEILNTLGSIRAHGGKGAFVSKWIINKSNLQVISGSDLMQQVYFWNTATQTSNASPTTGFAFHRFCSGDLPAVSAYYNSHSGLGTQAHIYMHGEEGATGFQMGTVASGPDAGKAYVLGKFDLATNGSGINAVGNWENALANPFEQDKTVVIANSDGGTGIMTNAVAVYVGTKTNTGSEVDKAGLTNGTLSFINVAGNTVEIVNNTTRATNITSGTAFTLNAATATTFSRPEDGVWNPLNPNQYFFVTTDQLDQTADGVGAQVGRSRLWRLNFTDIANPQLGGTIDLLLNGTEGYNMLDNMTADKSGHLILLEDVGNAPHNGKVWQYTIATNQLVKIAKHDPARFGDIGVPATSPFNQDEETSGVIDVSDILGAGMNLVVDQAHYTLPDPMVEGGQLMAFFAPASMGTTGTAPDTIRSCTGTGITLGTPATADNCSVASVTNNAPSTFPAGTTNVVWTVTDGSGNTATATQVVIVSDLAVTAASTPVTTIGGTDGTATATATGGTTPYTYVWAPGGQTTATASGLTAGPYSATVTDARGCTATATTTVGSPACNISASAIAGSPITCNGGSTTLTVTANGGTAPVQYSLNNGAFQPGNVFTAGAGTYTVTVKDASGCTATTNTVIVTQPTAIVVSSNAAPIALPGGSTTVNIGASGGTPPYTGTGSFTRSAGTYTFTVTDASGCTGSSTITLTDPVPGPANASINILTLNSGLVNQGDVVDVQVSVGNTGPSFIGNNKVRAQISIPIDIASALPNAQQTGLPPGWTIVSNTGDAITICNGSDYIPAGTQRQIMIKVQGNTVGGPSTITGVLRFSNGVSCGTTGTLAGDLTADNTSTSTIQVIPVCNITASASAGTIACFDGTTTLTTTATGGIPPLQYSLNGGTQQAGNTFTVSAGTYTVTVTDSNGCTATTNSVIITQPIVITASASAGTIACNGGITTLTVTATGGTGALQYSLNGGAFQANNFFTVNAAGSPYTVTVRDANLCTATTNSVSVIQPTAITASASAGTIVCFGGATTLTVTASGGTPPLQYSLNGGAFQPGNTFAINAAGSPYSVTVRDANLCTTTTNSVTVTQPIAITASATVGTIACFGGTTTLTVTAAGGTGTFQYSLNGGAFQAANTFTVNAAGSPYTVTVRDANLCIGTAAAVTVTQPTQLTATATATSATSGSNGTATAIPTGGTSPYTYSWNTVPVQTTITATGLAAGTYIVTVTDAHGCTATATATVTSNGCNLIVSAGPDKQICNGSSTTLTATASGGTTSAPPVTPFTELPTTSSDLRLFSGNIDYIAIGNTFSQSEDRTNCGQNATSSKTLTLPAGAVVKKAFLYWSGSGSLDNTVKLNGTTVSADGSKTYDRSGGFHYFGARKDVTSLVTASGTYTVSDLTWNNNNPYCFDNSAYGAWSMVVVYELASLSSAKIHVNAEKFQYTYPAAVYSTTINNVSVSSGCSANAKLTIVAFEGDKYKGEKFRIAGVLDADSNNFRGQAGPNLDIITKNAPSVAGGVSSLTYSIESYLTNSVFGPAIEGLFDYVKVLKYNNCPSGGCNNYKYEWKRNGTVVGTTQSITASTQGTYTVKVSDCGNCTATDDVIVSVSTLAASATVGTPIACNGGATTVTVTATGGTAPYTGTATFTRPAGTYSFTVTDAKGCTATTSVTITQPTALAVTATAPAIPCNTTTTTVTVSATGGTSPYTGTGTFTKGPGTWTFTVTDAKGCTASKTITIGNATACGPVDPNKCYKLLARNSGKALTVANSSSSNGANVEQRSYNGTNNQIWKFDPVDNNNNFYEVINVNSGKVLDVTNSSTQDGANIQQWTWANTGNQKWSLTTTSSYFVVKAKHSGKAMSVAGSSNANGANVEQRGNGSNANEQWAIIEVGCPGFNTKTTAPPVVPEMAEETVKAELDVTVQPNPSINYFNLIIKAADSKTPVSVRVLDAYGKVLSVFSNVGANSTLRIGSEKWTAGMYYAEVMQGGERKVVKMVRVN
jgi:hypothetical protein